MERKSNGYQILSTARRISLTNGPRVLVNSVFYEWLDKLEANIHNIVSSNDRLLLERHFSDSFGKEMSQKTFAALAKQKLNERKSGNLRMSTSGILSSVGSTAVAAGHNFFGGETDE